MKKVSFVVIIIVAIVLSVIITTIVNTSKSTEIPPELSSGIYCDDSGKKLGTYVHLGYYHPNASTPYTSSRYYFNLEGKLLENSEANLISITNCIKQ